MDDDDDNDHDHANDEDDDNMHVLACVFTFLAHCANTQ
jgi:hypothetical protein